MGPEEVDCGRLSCPSQQKGRHPGWQPLAPQSLRLHPPLPSQQLLPRPRLWAGTTLNPAAPLGAQTCSFLNGKNLGLQPRSDLIKAATAHQVVTRSQGQPEKVVTLHVPRLTYRPSEPTWPVGGGTARGPCTTPWQAPTPDIPGGWEAPLGPYLGPWDSSRAELRSLHRGSGSPALPMAWGPALGTEERSQPRSALKGQGLP